MCRNRTAARSSGRDGSRSCDGSRGNRRSTRRNRRSNRNRRTCRTPRSDQHNRGRRRAGRPARKPVRSQPRIRRRSYTRHSLRRGPGSGKDDGPARKLFRSRRRIRSSYRSRTLVRNFHCPGIHSIPRTTINTRNPGLSATLHYALVLLLFRSLELATIAPRPESGRTARRHPQRPTNRDPIVYSQLPPLPRKSRMSRSTSRYRQNNPKNRVNPYNPHLRKSRPSLPFSLESRLQAAVRTSLAVLLTSRPKRTYNVSWYGRRNARWRQSGRKFQERSTC